MSAPAEGTVHIDTGDLDVPERAVVNYVLQVREYLQVARGTVMDAAAGGDITPDTAAFTSQVVDALDGIILGDLAAIAGIDVPEGSRVDEAFTYGEGAA